MDKAVEVSGLTYGYETESIFEKLNLEVKQGEFLGILGPNGSGKSTLLKLILGFLKPWSGQAKLYDIEVSRFNNWSQVGYVSQKATSFNPGFPATVEEIVETGLHEGKSFFRPWSSIDRKKIQQVLDLVGFNNDNKKLVGELSGGQQQRVFLARALIRQPKILFLDEPTVGLDPKGYHQLAELLGRLNKEMDLTVVVVTHQLSCMIQHFNRVVYLEGGQLESYQPGEYMARCQSF